MPVIDSLVEKDQDGTTCYTGLLAFCDAYGLSPNTREAIFRLLPAWSLARRAATAERLEKASKGSDKE